MGTGFDRAPVVAGRDRDRVDAVHDALVVGGRPVWVGGGDVARRDDRVADGLAIEITDGQAFRGVADAGSHYRTICEVRQYSHRHGAAADLGHARRDGFADRVHEIGAHSVPGVHVQVHGDRGLPAGQREAAHVDLANAAAPLAQTRVHRIRRLQQLPGRCLDICRRPIDVGDLRNVDLPGQQRLVAACLETAAVSGKGSGKAQSRDDRRLLDDHRRQAADPVDEEVGRDRERQAEDADDVFDDLVGGRRQQDMATFTQRGCVVGRQPAALLEPVDALPDVQPV